MCFSPINTHISFDKLSIKALDTELENDQFDWLIEIFIEDPSRI